MIPLLSDISSPDSESMDIIHNFKGDLFDISSGPFDERMTGALAVPTDQPPLEDILVFGTAFLRTITSAKTGISNEVMDAATKATLQVLNAASLERDGVLYV
jgi:hypothetical protein